MPIYRICLKNKRLIYIPAASFSKCEKRVLKGFYVFFIWSLVLILVLSILSLASDTFPWIDLHSANNRLFDIFSISMDQSCHHRFIFIYFIWIRNDPFFVSLTKDCILLNHFKYIPKESGLNWSKTFEKDWNEQSWFKQ